MLYVLVLVFVQSLIYGWADLWYAVWAEWNWSKKRTVPIDIVVPEFAKCSYCWRKRCERQRSQVLGWVSCHEFFLPVISPFLSLILLLCDTFHRFIGVFRFIYDDVFGPFQQRAYADPCEKWQLIVACLQHFQMWVLVLLFNLKSLWFDCTSGWQRLLVGLTM